MMRASGVLLPVFSLPGRYGIGRFSAEAYAFTDFLREAGQSFWQILPICPTGYGDSPYQSFSTFAGNPYFIDPEELVREELLTEEELSSADFGGDPGRVDYQKQFIENNRILHLAAARGIRRNEEEFRLYAEKNAFWLDDFAIFTACKAAFGGKSLTKWEDAIRLRDPQTLRSWSEKLREETDRHRYLQYVFDRQWTRLKTYANERGIRIIGDIPIYASADSADYWAHPELFQTDENRMPSAVAGCPPDGFSADGQYWGNPLYDWESQRENRFWWWTLRLARCRELYDVIRIDHFRGFDEYYSIPAGETTAVHGSWKKGPGMDLIQAVRASIGKSPIIAEDLGYITDTVRVLVQEAGIPNMKVLEFAFDSRDSSNRELYLPHNYEERCVVYTGTHDNETLCGWLDSILPEELRMVQDYLGCRTDDRQILTDRLIRLAQRSVAGLCVIPMQDWLGLDNSARINTPNTTGGNWQWRMPGDACTPELAERMRKISGMYGR